VRRSGHGLRSFLTSRAAREHRSKSINEREHWKTGRWWMSRRRSNASNWQRFLDQRSQPTLPVSLAATSVESILIIPPPHGPPSYGDDSHDFSGSFQLSEDPHSHERANAASRNIDRRFLFLSLSLSPSLSLSLPLFSLFFLPAIVALAGACTGSGRNEKLRVVVTRRRVIVARNYDSYVDVLWKNV